MKNAQKFQEPDNDAIMSENENLMCKNLMKNKTRDKREQQESDDESESEIDLVTTTRSPQHNSYILDFSNNNNNNSDK